MRPQRGHPVAIPAPRRFLVVTWLVVAVVLGGMLAVAQRSYGPLDDPDQAYQRPGFLDARALPSQVPPVAPGHPEAGRPAAVFFVRPAQQRPLLEALASERSLARRADVAVVTSARSVPIPAPFPMATDPGGDLGRAYGMRVPTDGGPPVGYALVDRHGRVRYATLDPEVADGLAEVSTMLRAIP